MKRKSSESDPERPTTSGVTGIPSQTSSSSSMAHEKSQKRVGKRPGRKPSKIDQKAKLERSRQSARECRARKKLRYQYLEELVSSREKAVYSLREEMEMYKRWSIDLDRGLIPDGLVKLLAQEEMQKTLSLQSSPPSQSSTPTASPSSVDMEHMASHLSVQSSRLHRPPSGHLPVVGPQAEQTRQQQLLRQPSVNQSSQQLTSMSKGSRSFEECSRSTGSSSLYRSGSVPNLAATSSQQGVYPEPVSSATLVFRDFHEDSTNLDSTGFIPDLTSLGKVVSETETATNIPTIVSSQSPPSVGSKSGGAWTWEFSAAPGASQARTYPFTSASSVTRTPQPAQLATSQAFIGGPFRSGSSVSPVPNFLMSSRSSVSAETVSSPAVPYYQRPRSISDLAKKVTSSSLSSAPLSLSQQNLPELFDPAVTSCSSQDAFSTLSDSVTTCLSLTNSSLLQDAAHVCMGSELSASISEPIPHWYSFLDDLESVASLSARRGAYSDASTPTSSRARSGAGTPSSVDSPYSQQLLQQQPHQQDSGSDGNIPNIISDLLGQPPSS